MYYFDYKKVAREAGISQADLDGICQLCRKDFPTDDMLYELHVLRACMSIRDGEVTAQEILAESSDETPE